MRCIPQEDPNGCALACVAMLGNLTYKEVRDVYLRELSGDESVLLEGGCGLAWREIKNLLTHFQLPIMRLCNTPCIVSLGKHFVVIDKEGNKLDPAGR